jgi:mono/diheme cytochrome c family protein
VSKVLLRALGVLLVIGLIAGAVTAYSLVSRGLGTRTEPTRAEEAIALAMRRLATPRAVRDRANPVPSSRAVVDEGLEHFADHCAVCHANDGSGDTEIGRSLYPRAPDMRHTRTQKLSDGEIFSIIENGVRLTGMPAWGTGTPESERASWALVRFIRHLPSLTPAEKARMEALSPRSAEQWHEEEEARRFLAGEGEPPTTPPASAQHGPH